MSKKRRGYLYKGGAPGKAAAAAPATTQMKAAPALNRFKTAVNKSRVLGQNFKNVTEEAMKNLKSANIAVKNTAIRAASSIAKTAVTAMLPPEISGNIKNSIDKLEIEFKKRVENGEKIDLKSIQNMVQTQVNELNKEMGSSGITIPHQSIISTDKINQLISSNNGKLTEANINNIVNTIKSGIDDFVTNNDNTFNKKDINGNKITPAQKNKESNEQQTGQSENPLNKLFKKPTEEEIEEQKIQDDAEKISWQETFNELSRLYKDFKLAPGKVKLFIVFGYIIILTTSILSIYYVVRIFLDYNNSLLIKNKINFESLDYNISRSISFNPATLFQKNVKYKFVLFLILPIIALILIGVALIYIIKESNKDSIKSIIYILIGVAIVQLILSAIVNYVGYLSIRKDIVDIQKKISEFNNYIYLNLYMHEPFLNVLQMIPTNSFSMIKGIQVAMDNIAEEDKSNPDKIAKVLLTLNIYIHLQKMGFRNPNIRDAFKLFNNSNTSDPKLFTPSDYIYRKPTYISNNTTKIIDIYKNYKGNTNIDLLPGFIDPNESSITDIASNIIGDSVTATTTTLFEFAEGFQTQGSNISDDVFELAKEPIEEWIRNLNDLAFKMNPEKSFGGFIKILITIALVSVIPMIILLFATTLRHKLFKLVLFLTKSKTERLEIQINETRLTIEQLEMNLNNTNSSKKKRILQEKIYIYKDKLNEFNKKLTEARKEKN